MIISTKDVAELPYVELLARLVESNRPPGGSDTVRRIIAATNLRPGVRVLHAGCNAGFLSRELVRRTGCHVVGVDLSARMVSAARSRAAAEGVGHLATYCQADMRAFPFASGSFDVVLSAGALAFVDGSHEKALSEWARVVRPHGLIADSELFYAQAAPSDLRGLVSETIGVDVPEYGLEYWKRLFGDERFEPYYDHVDPTSLSRGPAEVRRYVNRMIGYLADQVADDARGPLTDRLIKTFTVLDENLSYLGYAIFVRVCRPIDAEPALYA